MSSPFSSPLPEAAVAAAPTSLKVMTVNTHKGFTALNRRFILPELRDAEIGRAHV